MMQYQSGKPFMARIEIDGKALARAMMSHPVEGRAHTPEQKREVIEQLYQLWMRRPMLRFSQMLLNWANGYQGDFYGVEDFQLVESLKAFYNEMDEWHGKEGQK